MNLKTLISRSITPYVRFENMFSPEECDRIIAIGESIQLMPGTLWNDETKEFEVDLSARKVLTSYHPRSSHTDWIYQRMDHYFLKVADLWEIEIDRTVEEVKYLSYPAGSHFGTWHSDTGRGHTKFRLISASVELNERSDYDGGYLEIYPATLAPSLHTPRGGGVLFLSSLPHRVTTVTAGHRRSLVNWVSGKPFEEARDL